VLPLLPLILATAAQEGKARPLGVIVGFVAAFTAGHAGAERAGAGSFGLSPDLNRTVSARSSSSCWGSCSLVPVLQLPVRALG
jgi:cytochrome c-type biogenesis protein